jgi:hypothetical protein
MVWSTHRIKWCIDQELKKNENGNIYLNHHIEGWCSHILICRSTFKVHQVFSDQKIVLIDFCSRLMIINSPFLLNLVHSNFKSNKLKLSKTLQIWLWLLIMKRKSLVELIGKRLLLLKFACILFPSKKAKAMSHISQYFRLKKRELAALTLLLLP